MKYLALVFALIILTSWSQNDSINQGDVDGKKTGHWVITGEQRNEPDYCYNCVIEEGLYKRSRKQGLWTKYYPNGQLKSIIEYENGKAQGHFTTYREDGSLKEMGIWESYQYKKHYQFSLQGCLTQEFVNLSDSNCKTFYKNDCAHNLIQKTKDSIDWNNFYIPLNYIGSADTAINNIPVYHRAGHGTGIWTGGPYSNQDSSAQAINRKFIPDSTHAKPKKAIAYTCIQQDKKNECKCYKSNEKLILEGQFKRRKLWNGEYYIYDKNGNLDYIEIYQNGKYIGMRILGWD
ncbi:MAG: hypothetical protein ACI9N1_001332 [Flavobacteriales bacterium]|jgi:hypothetical protein